MSSAWPPSARIVCASLIAVALATAAVLAYLSIPAGVGSDPVAPGAFVLRLHDEPRQLADVAFIDDQGRTRTLRQFRDKLLLVNLWATWCAPCREEMPALDRLQRELGGADFEVLALSIDSGGPPAVKRFYDEMGIRSLAIYVDATMRASGAFGAMGIPTTLLVDAEGREIGRRTGPAQWDGPDAVRIIKAYLEQKAKS
jgi:thiol-disulfide isomerase/thioredoxin